MSEAVVDEHRAVLPPLLQSLEALGFIAPPSQSARNLTPSWKPPARGSGVAGCTFAAGPSGRNNSRILRAPLEIASDAALAAFAGLRAGAGWQRRSDCGVSCAALRPARAGGAVSPRRQTGAGQRFLRRSRAGEDADLKARLAGPAAKTPGSFTTTTNPAAAAASRFMCGILHADRARPLVMALHDGSGNGRGFLWSWLRDARQLRRHPWSRRRRPATRLTKSTWALMGEDNRYPEPCPPFSILGSKPLEIDPTKLLLTGMSDGGTFCYVTGLESASPSPISHPCCRHLPSLMAEMADAERLRGLPVTLVMAGSTG